VAEETESDSLTRGFLFADLRGYTEYVERHGGEAAARLLSRYRELVRQQVARYRGAEIKTEGDSFYVVFPAVSAAVRAGLAIVADAREESAKVPDHPIRVGIGVHAGETFQTTEGYVGSPVNIAARLCSRALAGEVLVSDTVRALTSTVVRANFAARGRQQLKGIAEPIHVFAVSGTVDTTSPRVARQSPDLRLLLGGAVGIAALIGAGFMLRNAGFGSVAPSPTPAASATAVATSPSAAPGPSDGLSTSERRLLALIPTDLAASCQSAPDDAINPATATFRCDLPLGSGADTVWWDRFETKSLTALAIDQLAASRDLPEQACGPDVHVGKSAWSLGTTFSGQRLCWVDGGEAWAAWTYLDEQILARAVRADGDGRALDAWWNSVSAFVNTR
jgi:class 3 adenylate cyclase